MKKLLSVILLLIVTMTFSGCFSSGKKSPTAIATEQAFEIIRCINENDIEALKGLFCENIKSTHNLDEEIAKAIEFINGKIVSEGDWYGMYAGGESFSEGKLVKQNIHPGMENIITDTGSIYRISFGSYLVYDDDIKNVGMVYINIYDETNGGDNRTKYYIGGEIW